MSIKAKWTAMSTSEKIATVLRSVATVFLIGSAGCCVHETRQSKKMIRQAVSKIGDNVDVEVSEAFIQQAIEKAAKQQINKAASVAVREMWSDLKEDTRTQVEKAVKENYNRITDEVSTRLAKEADKINHRDILDDITEKAKDKLAETFDSKLDDIAEEYSKNLTNMGKIYEALADKMNSKA